MRSALARRAAVFGSTAILLLAPATAVAQADPAEKPSTGVSAQAALLPAELVEALQRDLRLTPDQYLAQSELGQKLAEFATMARTQFPDAFGGAWIDQAGIATVGLAGTDSAAARAAVEQAGFTSKNVQRSENQLAADREALNDWLDTLPADLRNLVQGVAVDIAGNNVVLRVDDTAGDLIDLLPPFLRGAARVVLGPVLPFVQPLIQPFLPPGSQDPAAATYGPDALLGGDPFAAVGGGVGLRCSLGFNATDRNGAPVNISAGHCDPNRTFAGTEHASKVYEMFGDASGAMIGTVEKTSLDRLDYSVIRPAAGTAQRFANNGVRVPGAAPIGITGTADPVVGAPVCKAGDTSGFNCGVVTAAGQTVKVGERVLADGFATNLCALQGDSGGTIVTGTLALGISSASNVGDYGMCEIAGFVSSIFGDTPELYATPINSILRENPGVRIRTS
ncbi:protease [Rhodococcus sp. ABRD24]|uniref:S1 family peptidase n=1 Tax=Rhodococcus sp. ABRD24 TaxID=2507582 RepID=UPI00103F9978|nr:S1 family peptidase [Rhodococcus sp. ABRD24]QBJ95965.1 protease [Rhodococcus sp. ABRD24]